MPPFLTDIYRPSLENNTTNMVSNRRFNGHLQEPIVFNGQMWDRKNKETDIYGGKSAIQWTNIGGHTSYSGHLQDKYPK